MTNKDLNILHDFNVLYLEDDENLLKHTSDVLEDFVNNIFAVKTSKEALDILLNKKVDVIISDINLPHMNGFEMITEILSLKPDQLFIVMTSYDTDQNILSSIQEGACSFLRKPLEIKDIQTSLLLCCGKIKSTTKQITPEVTIDYRKESIYKNNELIFLSQKSHKIFWLLCYNIEKLVSYDMFEDYVYSGESINKGALHTAILRIKQQLGKDLIIDNIQNQGYMLKVTYSPDK